MIRDALFLCHYLINLFKTPNMKNKINKQALMEKIQCLSGLSNEDKSQQLVLLAEQKKLVLVWKDRKKCQKKCFEKKSMLYYIYFITIIRNDL